MYPARMFRNVLNSNPKAQFVKLKPRPSFAKKHKFPRLEIGKRYFLRED